MGRRRRPIRSRGASWAFAAGDTITLTDLTLTGGVSALQLNLSVPYLLIQALSSPTDTGSVLDNDFYSGLTTTGGYDANGVLQNGYVTTPITLNGTVLTGFNADRLFLYNGELEVVPEPGTWGAHARQPRPPRLHPASPPGPQPLNLQERFDHNRRCGLADLGLQRFDGLDR